MEHSQSTSNFVVWHRKQGPLIPAPLDQLANNAIDISLILVGKFIDKRDFSARHIQEWVDSWFTRGRIKVTKEEKLFFFHCRDMQDRMDILGLYDTMNFRGALLVLKPWKPFDSFKSFNFSESAMWIKLEGIPLLINSKSLANEIYSRIGKVLLFDESSEKPGLKKHFRALVWIKTKAPLVPGMYIEVQDSRTIWVDIRYEGVFVFCKRCGKIGHKSSSCAQSWEKAKDDIEAAITEACKPEAPMMYGNPNASLYTNKIIGLPRTPEYLNTIVKLNEPRRPPDPSSSSSSSDDDGDDGGNQSRDKEMENASSNHEAHSKRCNSNNSNNSGPSKRARPSQTNGKNYERGGPSTLLAHDLGPKNQVARRKLTARRKGKSVLSISNISFKRVKAAKHKLSSSSDDVMLDTLSACQAAHVSALDNSSPSFPFQVLALDNSHIHSINLNTEFNRPILAPFPSSKDSPINTHNPPPSSFNQMTNHQLPRENLVEEMESNHSSLPHSSNSITQPPTLPLSPYHPQNQDNNFPILLPSDPLGGYFDNSHQVGNQEFGVNDEIHTSWDHLLGPGSTSSYFNSDDALLRGGPYENPYPLNEQIDWNELQNIFPIETSSLSPQTPLHLPGSHSSLQTGSSSSYHSVFPGIPSSEFADLRIFPTWSQPPPFLMEQAPVHEFNGNKRKLDELNDIVEAALLKSHDEERKGKKSALESSEKICVAEEAVDQEKDRKLVTVKTSQPIAPTVDTVPEEKKPSQGPKPGNDFKFKIPYQLEKGKEVVLCDVGPRKGSGRPPRPKQIIVQALVCEKKRKFEEFEPLIDAFIGGLALFWSSDVNLVLKDSSTNYFACIINDLVDGNVYIWNLILLYGSPYLECRGEVWEKITYYVNRNPIDTVIMGDFNQLEYLSQKMGGSEFISGKEQFTSWKNQHELLEINFQGQNFTWCNNRSEAERIYERLDRAYASENWLHRYSEATILNMPILISDHSPILLITSPIKPRKKSPIKMEAWCFDFKEVDTIISSHWQFTSSGSPMYTVAQKCRNVRYKLFQWCKNYKEANNIKWEELLNKCGEIQSTLPQREGGILDEEAKKESIHKLQVQLKFWQQRAKSKWKAWEDTNTKWFFRKAKSRKQRNEILMLRNSAGRWVTAKEDIQKEFLSYFTNIFQGSQHNQEFWDELDGIQHLVPRIDEAQIEDIVKPVSKEESTLPTSQVLKLQALKEGMLALKLQASFSFPATHTHRKNIFEFAGIRNLSPSPSPSPSTVLRIPSRRFSIVSVQSSETAPSISSDFTSTVGSPSLHLSHPTLSPRHFTVFNFLACAVAISATWLFCSAIPALLAFKRAAESLEKLLDVTREELPDTMAAVRLSGMEISDLTMELSDLGQEITQGVKRSTRAVHIAEEKLRHFANMTSTGDSQYPNIHNN
ncbi:hypothetical protein BVRB_6g139370 isoform B [Beta vulgaris subsp. vulgaris]|nr:hypothetical protein BVRB_6g139370 isoform B [Beta vulgaris subsp. vulgaris]